MHENHYQECSACAATLPDDLPLAGPRMACAVCIAERSWQKQRSASLRPSDALTVANDATDSFRNLTESRSSHAVLCRETANAPQASASCFTACTTSYFLLSCSLPVPCHGSTSWPRPYSADHRRSRAEAQGGRRVVHGTQGSKGQRSSSSRPGSTGADNDGFEVILSAAGVQVVTRIQSITLWLEAEPR